MRVCATLKAAYAYIGNEIGGNLAARNGFAYAPPLRRTLEIITVMLSVV